MRSRDPVPPPAPPSSPPLSRRRFLQRAAGLTALVVLGAWPEPTAGATLPLLTAAQLTGAMAALPKTGYVRLPGGGRARAVDVRAAAAAFAVGDGSAPSPATNPVAALGVLVALAAWSGRTGPLDLTVALPKAPVRPLRLGLPRLPAGASNRTLAGAVPPRLVVRPRGSLVLVGTVSGKRLLVALEDPARTVAGHRRLELAVLRATDLAPLLATIGARLHSTGTVVLLASGAKVALRPLQATLAARLLRAAGVLFVDQVPIQPVGATTPLLTVQPIVPAPPPTLATRIRSISQAADGRVLGSDAGGTATARAMQLVDASWSWVGHAPGTSYLLDYTPREYGEAIGVRVGSESGGWLYDDPAARALFRSQASIATIDTGLYWVEVEPQRGVFDFGWPDRQLDTWRAAGLPIRGHGLVFPTFWPLLPAWLTGGTFSRTELTQILVNHVERIVDHYKGRVSEWIVVNEPFFPGRRENDPFYRVIGEEYIDLAFATAREIDPTAVLIFNDNDNHHSRGSVDLTMGISRRLLEKGLIDAVGLQMHIADLPWVPGGVPTAEDVTATIRGYGIPCVVTEFDYDLSAYPGTQTDRYQRQAEVYRWLIEAILDAGVKEITFWGLEHQYSWLLAVGVKNGAATMFEDPTHPKPAYFAVRDVLKKRAGLA
jgi:endo-1,4-beta-xylanase